MSEIKIKLFGKIAEKVKANEIVLIDIKDSDELIQKLYTDYPELKSMKFAISVDRQLIHQNSMINSHSEIAILPPFSGG